MNKKAESLSMSLIVIAAICIVVLVVVVSIFVSNMRNNNRALQSCVAKKGVCQVSCGEFESLLPNTDCGTMSPDKPVCCIKVS